MTKQRPGRKPTTAPKRTARLIVQVFPEEYDQVVAATTAAGFSNYADYVRQALGLDIVTTPTGDRAAGGQAAEGDTDV